MHSKTISAGEYSRWMTTADAKTLLASQDGWSESTAVKTMIQRLKDQLIDSVARNLVWKFQGQREEHSFRVFSVSFWPDEVAHHAHNFWKSGDIELYVPAEGHAIRVGPTMSLYSVRFRPEHIRAIMPPREDLSLASDKKDEPKTPLADAELRRFCRLYLDTWGHSATETKALAACKAIYAENKISRDPFRDIFRELRGPVKPGKKVSRG